MALELKNKTVATTGSVYYDSFKDGDYYKRVRVSNHLKNKPGHNKRFFNIFSHKPHKMPETVILEIMNKDLLTKELTEKIRKIGGNGKR